MEERTCRKCNTTKPITDFRLTKGYRARVCKQCFYNTKCRKCGKNAYGSGMCPTCARRKPHTQSDRNFTIESWLSQCLRSTKAASPSRKARGYRVRENDLTIEFLLSLWEHQKGICYITGIEMETKSGNICSASIDRVDCDQGYLQTNVVLVCQWANLGRSRYSIDEFRRVLSMLPGQSKAYRHRPPLVFG